jgi:hypothetical protein
MPSDIHVLVQFQDQCVFAGEELRCTITFRNILEQPEPQALSTPPLRNSRTTSIGKHAGAASRQPSAQSEGHITRTASRQPSHGSEQQSASAHRIPSISGEHSPQSAPEGAGRSRCQGHKQQRSVSIISVTSPTISPSQNAFPSGLGLRPAATHRRSSTIQISSGRSSISNPCPLADLQATNDAQASTAVNSLSEFTFNHKAAGEVLCPRRQRQRQPRKVDSLLLTSNFPLVPRTTKLRSLHGTHRPEILHRSCHFRVQRVMFRPPVKSLVRGVAESSTR